MPSASDNRLRRSGTKWTVIDGPFAETKEYVAGLASLEAESKSNCIEVTNPYLALGGEGDSDPFVTLRQSNTNFTRIERDFHNSCVGKHVVCLLDESRDSQNAQ